MLLQEYHLKSLRIQIIEVLTPPWPQPINLSFLKTQIPS